jgi:hypothetical protein
VVALSLDKRTALLGEVKWHEGPAPETTLRAAYRDLVRRGIPELPEIRQASRVVHAIFVPQVPGRAKRRKAPYVLVDAEDVIGALR